MFAAHSTIAGNNVPGRVSSHLRYRELSGGFSHFPLLAIIFIIIIIIIIVIIIIINTILKKIVANSWQNHKDKSKLGRVFICDKHTLAFLLKVVWFRKH